MQPLGRAASAEPHGVLGWPFDTAPRDSRPDRLPDGRAWPRVRVITLPVPGGDPQATAASVAGQLYPEARHDVLATSADARAAIRDVLDDPDAAFLLLLRAGDLLAPGALIALCLEAALSGADVIAGLRVLFDAEGVHGLDVLAAADGPIAAAASYEPRSMPGCGEFLMSRAALLRAGGLDPGADDPLADLWPRLAARGARLARIGRPVLLKRSPAGAHGPRGLAVASLTDGGHRGGAGIAHRRLAEALELSGHRIAHLRLSDEAPPAAAEWTDRFPRTEAAIRAGHDLVLAGNLHGATRSTAILGRLAQAVPVAVVLHDLFAVTGRCAHPKACALIATGCGARCPSPDEFPQLAPGRIAEAHAEKRAVLAGERAPILLANSDWTAARARALAPPEARVARISLAFPAGVFRPGDRAALRRRLGLPPDDVLIVFSAVIADAPDKGFDDLVATLRRVARPGIGFVALGRLDDPAALKLPNLLAPGPIGAEADLAAWYGACDICLTASRLETLGQTPIEAGLCGLPSVAYRATGLTSAVIDGVTGLLAEPAPGALADALESLIADAPRRAALGAFARIALESRFSHAAAAISLHEALPVLRAGAIDGRLRFNPAMLGRFAFAAERHPGATGTVAASSPAAWRVLRRMKHAAIGRGMPLWLRRALYVAALVRGALVRRRSP